MSVPWVIADSEIIHAQVETGGVSILIHGSASWNNLTMVCLGLLDMETIIKAERVREYSRDTDESKACSWSTFSQVFETGTRSPTRSLIVRLLNEARALSSSCGKSQRGGKGLHVPKVDLSSYYRVNTSL